jgi:hypothetical protein
VQDGVLAIDEAYDPHVVEGNDPANDGGNPVEDFLKLQGFGGDFGDLRQNACHGLCIDRFYDTHTGTP